MVVFGNYKYKTCINVYNIYILYININHTPGRGLTILLNIHMQKSTSLQLSLQSIYTNYTQSREYSEWCN
jgi:hypothetical protein